jgi:hypothetical protein
MATRESSLRKIEDDTPLSIACSLIDGRTIATVGEAASFLAGLTEKERERPYWQTALRMLSHAINEPEYLNTAALSFRSALIMDGLAKYEVE